MRIILFLIAGAILALSAEESSDTDGDQTRKILGSSVVTSVSVIMDTGNGSKAVFTDAVGKQVPKPASASELASPINLLNPDRYEFYTFDDNGDLIKRLMSLEEIQGIIATGDSDGYDLDSFTSLGYLPEKRVNDVVNNVQSVLKEEMETHKDSPPDLKPMFDTPDVSDSWSMILPAVFGNSGEDIKPERPIAHVTPDTIMIEPNMEASYLMSSPKVVVPASSTVTPVEQNSITSPRSTSSISTPRSTTNVHVSSGSPLVFSTQPQLSTADKLSTVNIHTTNKIDQLTPLTEKHTPLLNVEFFSNSKSTEKPSDQIGAENSAVIEMRPLDTIKPNYELEIATNKPLTTVNVPLTSLKPTTYIETEQKSTSANIENSTKAPLTPVTFISSSVGSTIPDTISQTKTPAETNVYVPLTTIDLVTPMPTTMLTTEVPLSTWRPKPDNTEVTAELLNMTQTFPPPTRKPEPTTIRDILLALMTKEQSQNNFTVLAEQFLNQNVELKQTEQPPTTSIAPQEITPESLTTFTIIAGEDNRKVTTTDFSTSSQASLTEKNEDDLSTLSSQYFGTKNNLLSWQKFDEVTTQLPLEQSLNTAQKISASELLDQLLSTTNIGEINTELALINDPQPNIDDEDQRFEMSTQGESKLSETKTSTPTTTEQFIIKVMDNGDPLATTDKTLMESIEQLLSQAVGNVEEALANINDTEKIKNMLNSSSKNMTDIQIESATLASSMIDTNFDRNEEPKQTTTESSVPETTIFDDTRILSESVGSLLSQIYDSNRPNLTTIEYDIPTEKYSTVSYSDTKTNPTTITIPITEKLPETTIVNNDVGNTETYEKLPTEEKTTVSFESTTVSYVQLSALSKTDNDFELEPINTQSTILSIDHEDNNIQNLTKPAKSDVSLEQIIDEEIKKNISLTLNETTTTKLYNEETTTNNYDLNTNTLKNPSEILHTEETMSALHNGTAIKGNDINPYTENKEDIYENKTSILLPEKTTETSTDEVTQFTTTDHFVSLNDVLQVSKRPATIIIIKRTKKPSTEEPTTVAMNAETDFSNTNNLETTTAINDNLDLTTYIKQKFETTVTLPETTELYSDLNSENSTETTDDDGPTIEVIISEINQHVSETPRPMPTDQPVFVTTPVNPAHIKTVDDNINPQESSNIDIKISTDDHKNTGTTDSSPLQNENPSNNEGKPESTWTLVPTIAPHSDERIVQNYSPPVQHFPEIIEPPAPIDLTAKPLQGFGLEDSTSRLDTDIYQFAQLCNELAFGFWKTVTSGLSSARSVFVSPFGATSLLAMVFLGARGATSGEMNEILRLDDMVTFNPHLIFKNVSESIKTEEPDSGVASSAIIRELFSDRSKGKLLPFYKERAKAFYDGYVEEVSFREIGDVIRRRTNLQVKKYTNGRMAEFLKDSSVVARSPLAGVSINIFQTDCAQASTDGRDGELHFVVHPSIRQRRLVPIPAIVYKSGFLAGYEPSLDATAIALGTKEQTVSTILVIPGQQGVAAPGDGLARLEKRLVESSFKKGAWSRLLRSLIPRPGLEVQIPRFSHRSVINATVTLKRMGLHDLFDVENADLRGLNGVANELYLSDMLQVNSFATCGEKRIGETHHSEIYPATAASARNSRHLENYQSENIYYKSDLLEEPKDYQRAFHDPLHDPSYLSLPLSQRPRQARVPETPRLKFDRPFIYFVRHNPTGLILHMGRFNPRLLP